MDNAPKIFELSRKKSYSVIKALTDNNWITQINTQQGISLTHIQEVVMLWERLADISLTDGVRDSITWKLSIDGVYSASSAYKAQFEGLTISTMLTTVCKGCPPPPKSAGSSPGWSYKTGFGQLID